jgi:predicted extracellular nuclease
MLAPPRLRLTTILVTGALLLGAGPRPTHPAQAGVRVFDVQGAAHVSPLADQLVADVPGVVTALRSNGFYLQDPEGDDRPETSDAVFVFIRDEPPPSSGQAVAVGDSVRVSGQVREFRPAGNELGLSVTEIAMTAVSVVARNQPLPPPVVLGPAGRVVPRRLVAADVGGANVGGEDVGGDVGGDVEAGPGLRPDLGALDFFESLEGMRVQVNDGVVVGRRSWMGELPVLLDDGAGVARRTTRGGLLAAPSGEAPPLIVLVDGAVRSPPASVGDRLPGPSIGVVDYAFGGYRVRLSELPPIVLGGIEPERAAPAPRDTLSVATFNVENLSARERPARLARLAERIVDGLGGPDLLAIQEIQDDSGAGDDGTVTGGRTAQALIEAIGAAGGPDYAYREVPPENNQDGGELGANIRVAFLFRTDRGLAFVDRPGGDAVTPVAIVADTTGPRLSVSPGRLAPGRPAWAESRKPLVGELTFNGRRLFVVGCHFVSRRGDQPLFGRFQPPARPSEAQRVEQARLVNTFARELLAADPAAKLIVLGDLNDGSGSATLAELKGDLLTDLLETLPEADRYSYVFGGQAEVIDHILVSPGLLMAAPMVDIVHGNAELIGAASDHDPVLARFTLPTQ